MLPLTKRYLVLEAESYRGSGGVSAENRAQGFQPAFIDTSTGATYLSTFVDGRPAPFHLLDGMPDDLVVARDCRGRVAQVLGTIIAGFLREGVFYTREQAAALVCGKAALGTV
ncbi:MAG: hypothetical protein IT531_11680 [Burkholderiales bacterium]|nr:hypothetical protein [Burkholderiales bacterium]